jgi:hypothetical protein
VLLVVLLVDDVELEVLIVEDVELAVLLVLMAVFAVLVVMSGATKFILDWIAVGCVVVLGRRQAPSYKVSWIVHFFVVVVVVAVKRRVVAIVAAIKLSRRGTTTRWSKFVKNLSRTTSCVQSVGVIHLNMASPHLARISFVSNVCKDI